MFDKIIAVVSHRDYVLIFKESGKIYRLDIGDIYKKIEFVMVANVPDAKP